MKVDKKALIAMAIGWSVLFYILIITTANSIGPLNSVIASFRTTVFRVLGLSLPAFVATVAIQLVLCILLLVYLVRVWLFAIRLTRALVRFIFFEEGTLTGGDISDKRISTELLLTLFGKDVRKLNRGLFWLTLRSFMIIWAIIILLTLITSFVSYIVGY